MRPPSATPLLVLVLLLATLAACAKPASPVRAPVLEQAVVIKTPGPMRPPVPTRLGRDLAALGLDPKNHPPIETLDIGTKRRLMKTFSQSLGVPCVGCHAEGDLAADTHRKRVAKRMYNELVRVLAMEDGQPVFCDSCHQGAMFFLDRRDKTKLADYMSDGMAGKMKRADGKDHDCATCHGDAPDFAFIAGWKREPAPDVDLHPAAPAQAPAGAEPPSPSRAAAAPAKPRPVARKAMRDCGDKNNLCPLQKWMRKNVSPAVAANDAAALATALDRIAKLSPDPSWTWAEMSRTAADAARRGDIAEARKSCQGCHNAYKASWREKYRTRVVH
jgi:hypothetical protein